MTRFEQLRISKMNPFRWEIILRGADNVPRSMGAHKARSEAEAYARSIGGEVLDRTADGSGDILSSSDE